MKRSIPIATTVSRNSGWKRVDALGKRFCRQPFPSFLAGRLVLSVLVGIAAHGTNAFAADDRKIVAGLDTEYQAAVKKNDAITMNRILAEDFKLVTGCGKTYTKADLLAEARSGRVHYERQDDTDQTVRVWGDTAVITAKLSEKGTDDGRPFEKTVWFSDTYVRTPTGWKYVFGQSSLQCPKPRE
ncbi:MAG: nuclear transport factor 2 family protein [Candidatus Sulfotelmatobacter sp.]